MNQIEHLENQIKFTQKTLATLQYQKKKEKEDEQISDRRKRWFNNEIDKERDRLRELIEEADN